MKNSLNLINSEETEFIYDHGSITAMQAAKVACEASGWMLTNLQLQKILYIAHMIYAGNHDGGRLITNDRFEAWSYGPSLPSVYRHVSSFGSQPILNIFRSVESPNEGEKPKCIRDAVEKLAPLPPFLLVEITHHPGYAWDRNYDSRFEIPIPQRDIHEEYTMRFL